MVDPIVVSTHLHIIDFYKINFSEERTVTIYQEADNTQAKDFYVSKLAVIWCAAKRGMWFIEPLEERYEQKLLNDWYEWLRKNARFHVPFMYELALINLKRKFLTLDCEEKVIEVIVYHTLPLIEAAFFRHMQDLQCYEEAEQDLQQSALRLKEIQFQRLHSFVESHLETTLEEILETRKEEIEERQREAVLEMAQDSIEKKYRKSLPKPKWVDFTRRLPRPNYERRIFYAEKTIELGGRISLNDEEREKGVVRKILRLFRP